MSFRIFLCQQVTDISFCIPTDNIIIFFREKIISHGMQANTPTGYSLQTQQSMVDASQFS